MNNSYKWGKPASEVILERYKQYIASGSKLKFGAWLKANKPV